MYGGEEKVRHRSINEQTKTGTVSLVVFGDVQRATRKGWRTALENKRRACKMYGVWGGGGVRSGLRAAADGQAQEHQRTPIRCAPLWPHPHPRQQQQQQEPRAGSGRSSSSHTHAPCKRRSGPEPTVQRIASEAKHLGVTS